MCSKEKANIHYPILKQGSYIRSDSFSFIGSGGVFMHWDGQTMMMQGYLNCILLTPAERVLQQLDNLIAFVQLKLIQEGIKDGKADEFVGMHS